MDRSCLPRNGQAREAVRSRPTPDLRFAPIRTCVGCRRRRAAAELVRCTLDGSRLTLGGASSGRGAWLCANQSGCATEALRRKAFDRAWRRAVPADVADDLRISFGESTDFVAELTVAPPAAPTWASGRGKTKKG